MRALRRRYAAVAVSLTSVVVTVAAACGNGEGVDCGSFRVDRQAWQSERSTVPPNDGELTPRQRIADAFIECGTLNGKSRSDVRQLLGPPEVREESLGEWSYFTGPERGDFVLDEETLNIKFIHDRVAHVTRGET